MDKVLDLLKGSYWMLDLSKIKLKEFEIDFLKIFFDIKVDHVIDDMKERSFLILRKKSKFISNPLFN